MVQMEDLEARAKRWLAVDPDPETRATVEGWLRAGDAQALRVAFDGALTFGTGGLRGEMGPGTTRMNRLMIRRAAAAWIDALLASGAPARAHGVALAFDGRHHSRQYAEDAARIIAGRGVPVYLSGDMVPTPILSFATPYLGCVAGAIVTASHNPPADNGFKVFDQAGAQILSPFDVDVADRMAAMDDPGALAARDDHAIRSWPDDLRATYFARALALRVRSPGTTVRVAYTPMHGVGGAWTPEALARAGHADVHPVPSQQAPDGDFPTVAFPNPEEAGALDALLAHADEVGAHLALANDPDADRLAVAVRHDGSWVTLSGNELGALLAEELLLHGDGDDRLVATTIVSSTLLSDVAASHGARCVETLTGFKWIAQQARAHEAAGGTFVLGMEESIGYTVRSLVRDKDGISAAVLVVDLAAALAEQGLDLVDALEALFDKHGRHVCRTVSVRLPGAEGRSKIEEAMATIRRAPPWSVAGLSVAEVVDVSAGVATGPDGAARVVALPSSNVLGLVFADGGRAWVRPSGTEPKIKFYVEVVVSGDRSQADQLLDRVHEALRAQCGLAS